MRNCDYDISRMKKWTLDLRKHSRICMLQFHGLRCTCGGRPGCQEAREVMADIIAKGRWP